MTELRPCLLGAKLEQALLDVLNAADRELSRADDSEGALRLKQSAKQALDMLNGKLDGALQPSDLKGLLSSKQGAEASEKTLRELPIFNTFISHKRSSA